VNGQYVPEGTRRVVTRSGRTVIRCSLIA